MKLSRAMKVTRLTFRSTFCTANERISTMEKNNSFLLTLLVCPLSKEPLQFDVHGNRLISSAANVAYPMTKEGCINMTVNDAYIFNSEDTSK